MQHWLTRPTFTPLVAHVMFCIIGYSQVLERFPNGNLGRGWVFVLGVHLLMHPMLDWFWIHARDMFCHNFMWCMMMTSPQCLICVHQLLLHTGPNWSALPQQLHCTLKAKLEHGNLSPSWMLTWVILHRILWMLTLHLQPLLPNIVREMMGILMELETWSHTTKIQWLNKWRSATKGRIMRSRAIDQIFLQLNQRNSECQITSNLIQVDYNALLEVQYWVGRIKFTLIPQQVSTNSKEVQQKHA